MIRLLTSGRWRGVPRSVRFAFLELAELAAEHDGRIVLGAGLSAAAGLHDLLGGRRRELADLVRILGAPLEPGAESLVRVEGEPGALVVIVPEWAAFLGDGAEERVPATLEAPRAMTAAERAKRHRDRVKDRTPGVTPPVTDVTADVTESVTGVTASVTPVTGPVTDPLRARSLSLVSGSVSDQEDPRKNRETGERAGARGRESGVTEAVTGGVTLVTAKVGCDLPALDAALPSKLRERVDAITLATGLKIDADAEWRVFVGHLHERGTITASLDASWAKWVTRAAQYAKSGRHHGGPGPGRPRGGGPGAARITQPRAENAPWLDAARAGGQGT